MNIVTPTGVPVDRPEKLRIRLLGPVSVERDGQALPLPSSRKVRALLAFLLLAPGPVARSHLCNLLRGAGGDPKGELRWCVSKIRRLLARPGSSCLESSRDAVAIRVDGCVADVVEIERAIQDGIHELGLARVRALSALYAGTFLESLRLNRSPRLDAWVVAQRRRFQSYLDAIHEQWIALLQPDAIELFVAIDRWLALAPANRRPHEILLASLARSGRIRDGQEHLALAGRLFRRDGADYRSLRETWERLSWNPPGVESITCARAAHDGGSYNPSRRITLAVAPLSDLSLESMGPSGLAAALSHDLAAAIAMHRSLEVISYETMMAIDRVGIGLQSVGHVLNADYVVTGYIRRHTRRLQVALQVLEKRTAQVCWAEDLDCSSAEIPFLPSSLGSRMVAAVVRRSGLPGRMTQMYRPTESFKSWEAYHQGLRHMYLFTPEDIDCAQHCFQLATQLDPAFAGALAGLSFTHFQNAFLLKVSERDSERDLALDCALRAVRADERDPLTHFALGRAHWLRDELRDCTAELEQAIALSTNFAQGHYALGFVRSQSGDADSAIASTDRSRTLSPYDPLMFAMLASRAMAHLRLGQYDQAATWAVQAIGQWNAHVHTWAIAAHCLAAAGRTEQARSVVGTIHKMRPGYGIDDYLSAMHYAEDAEDNFRRHAKLIGFA